MRYFASIIISITGQKGVKLMSGRRGTTLIELLVATVVFSIFITLIYPALLFVTNQVTILNDRVAVNDRGKRIMDFIADDLEMIGFIIGPTARVPYCTLTGNPPATPNVIVHVDGDPYDTLTFLTSIPVELEMSPAACFNNQTQLDGTPRKDYLLTTRGDRVIGGWQLLVDAAESCIDDYLIQASGANNKNNGRALITFETIAPSIVAVLGGATQVYYTISSFGNNNSINLSQALVQDIPDDSTVFTVRQYRYTENGARDLQRLGWNSACTNADLPNNNPPEYPSDTLDASNGADGGIDGLQFEYLSVDPISGLIVTDYKPPDDLRTLRAIKVWLLLRAEFPDKNYKEKTNTYNLYSSDTVAPGNQKITFDPADDDNYRRVLLSRTVEVKNIGF